MLKITARTDVGRVREINQDSYYISNEDISLCIIADGMGGYNGGEVASNLAILTSKKKIEEKFHNSKNENQIVDLIKKAILEAHEKIVKESKKIEDLEEMGTTLDVCLIYENKLYIGHIGDSRVYMIRNGNIKQLTTDHSYVEDLIKEGSITREEAYNHPKKHMLMKALGGEIEAEPDIYIEELEENDCILMCTDGITNMLKDDEICRIILDNKNIACQSLIEEANLKGGLDNITVVLIENY